MQGPGPRRVLLLLAGDSELSDRRAGSPKPTSAFLRLMAPAVLLGDRTRTTGADPETDEHRFPADQVEAAEIVLDSAKPLGVQVEVVDLNLPGIDHAVVDRYFGPDDVLPVLARGDGQRLVGAEEFTRRSVRQFLAAA